MTEAGVHSNGSISNGSVDVHSPGRRPVSPAGVHGRPGCQAGPDHATGPTPGRRGQGSHLPAPLPRDVPVFHAHRSTRVEA